MVPSHDQLQKASEIIEQVSRGDGPLGSESDVIRITCRPAVVEDEYVALRSIRGGR